VLGQEGVAFFDHNRLPFQKVSLTSTSGVHEPQQSVMLNPWVLVYEILVPLAQLTLHEMAMVTLSLKNLAISFPTAVITVIPAI
jgi:hypothetical protein